MTRPQASVIIPHHNDEEALIHCLNSLAHCDHRADVEIIVVDNGAPKLDHKIIHAHPDIRFLRATEKGAAHARNYGVRHSNSRILIFTDSDCQVPTNFLTKAMDASIAHDISGGAIDMMSNDPDYANAVEAFEHVFAFNQQHYIQRKGFSVTANLVTNTDVFKHVGPFRAGVSEDYDWGQRATEYGYKIKFKPNLRVFHPSRSSWEGLTSKWRRITIESYGIHRSRRQSTALWLFRALLMPLSVPAHIPKVLFSSALNGPSERIAAIKTLARIRIWRMREMLRVTTHPDFAKTN
ncbi:MAG: glycosyltransferase [Litoreibacter sp.]|uniref:glycosyltransferase n=1 Tax=Litoreibacter sp. TaxID=1969459 RepID=UPI0032974A47